MDTLVRCSVYGTLSNLLRQRNSKACILLSISADRVHASHPYTCRAVDMTMALRSLIFVLIEMDLLLSRGCNFANADEICKKNAN